MTASTPGRPLAYSPLPPGSKAAGVQHWIGDEFIIVLEGTVRSMKTITAIIYFIRDLMQAPPGRILIVGKTERTALKNIVEPMQRMLGKKRVQVRRGSGIVHILGREVEVIGAPNIAAVEKIQGAEFVLGMVDEAANINAEFFDMLGSRFTSNTGYARLWVTSNPDNPNHWLLKDWLEKAALWVDQQGVHHVNPDADNAQPLIRVSFTIDDNPFLSDKIKRRLRSMYSGVFYQRMILGLWVAAEGVVYSGFDKERHVIPVGAMPTTVQGICTGIDHGMTGNTRGYALKIGPAPVGHDGDGEFLYITREWAPDPEAAIGQQVTDYKAHIAGDQSPGRWHFVDPAAKAFIRQLTLDGVTGVNLAKNEVIPGIQTFDSLLAAGRVFITDDCTEAIREFYSYLWDTKAAEKGIDKVIKKDDHSMDAIRYAVWSSRHRWGKRIPVTVPTYVPDEDEPQAA